MQKHAVTVPISNCRMEVISSAGLFVKMRIMTPRKRISKNLRKIPSNLRSYRKDLSTVRDMLQRSVGKTLGLSFFSSHSLTVMVLRKMGWASLQDECFPSTSGAHFPRKTMILGGILAATQTEASQKKT